MPLLSMRQDTADQQLGETLDSLSLLERLLRCENNSAHERIAAILWDRCQLPELCLSVVRILLVFWVRLDCASFGERRTSSRSCVELVLIVE